MTIGIDFDGTMKSSSQDDTQEIAMWAAIVEAFRENGHQVIIATNRQQHSGEMDIDRYSGRLNVPVVYCHGFENKDQACRHFGYVVGVWIDDCPETCRWNPPLVGTSL